MTNPLSGSRRRTKDTPGQRLKHTHFFTTPAEAIINVVRQTFLMPIIHVYTAHFSYSVRMYVYFLQLKLQIATGTRREICLLFI